MVPFFVLLHVMSQYEFQNHWRAGIQTAIILEEYSWVDKKIQSLNPFEAYIFSSGGECNIDSVCTNETEKNLRQTGNLPEIAA